MKHSAWPTAISSISTPAIVADSDDRVGHERAVEYANAIVLVFVLLFFAGFARSFARMLLDEAAIVSKNKGN